ncbi:unnamed protein product, partial [marine sediment metagenome]
TYPGGNTEYSSDSGQDWWSGATSDFMFEEYGATPGIAATPGLLHIRHPALLTIVHTRGELTIKEYESLSSLDEEYLTTQVGIDIQKGDHIKATTLPGTEYSYPLL